MTTASIPTKPHILKPDLTAIPPEMKAEPRWCGFKQELREKNGKAKWTKPPVDPHTGRAGDSTDPAKWGTLAEAVAGWERFGLDGIGFVLGDGWAGIDEDDCVSDDGEIDPAVLARVGRLNTYTEFSVGGRGVHSLFRGTLPGGRRRKGNTEMYDAGRYFTFSGARIPGTPATVEERTAEVAAIHAEVFVESAPRKTFSEGEALAKTVTEALGDYPTDQDVINKALAARNGHSIRKLWEGNTEGYASQSEADLALCSRLAFWTGGDTAKLDRLFRKSGLFREKWDEKHGEATYGAMTIAKALSSGGEAYDWSTRRKIGQKSPIRQDSPVGEQIDVPASVIGEARPAHDLTDLGNSQRFISENCGDVRYCYPWRKWLVWDGRRWMEDVVGEVSRRMKSTILQLFHRPEVAMDERRGPFLKFAEQSCKAERINAALTLAQSEPGVPILPNELNRNASLFNCHNGTFDFVTGELREHRRSDFITQLCPTDYVPEPSSYIWDRFIDSTFGGRQTLIDFVRCLLGYSLTGSVVEHILAIFYGIGANGKSTLMNAVQHTLGGDYCIRANKDLLIVKKNEGHSTERMDLFGKRIVIVSEINDGNRLDESFVKDLTGGDAIRGRRMREDTWEYHPTHSLILPCNHKPQVRGTDLGVWRRLRLVPFDQVFNGDSKDPDLPEKLRAEAEGILAWLIRGALDWQTQGLGDSPEVAAATASYRDEQDVLAAFIADCCLVSSACRERASSMYEAFRQWCDRTGEFDGGQRRFGQAMTEKGFERFTNAGTWYRGIGLLANERNERNET